MIANQENLRRIYLTHKYDFPVLVYALATVRRRQAVQKESAGLQMTSGQTWRPPQAVL